MKKQSGITLVALVITIIILIILSAVTMSALLSENGLITKVREGVARYGEKQNEEENFFKSFNIDNLQTIGEETEPEVIDPNRRAFKVIPTVDGIQYEEGKAGYTFDVYLNNDSTAYKTNVTTFSETLDVGTIVTIKTNPTPECAKSQSQTEVVAGAGNEVVSAIWKSGTFRYYKIKITKLRGIPDSKAIQLSEWNLYDRSQNKFTYPTGTTITATLNGGSYGSGIENIIDNNTSTKYCTTAWGSSQTGECNIVMDFGENNYLDIYQYIYYSYCTANDSTNRDPISWEIYGSNTNQEGEFVLIDSRNDEDIITTRRAETEKYEYKDLIVINYGQKHLVTASTLVDDTTYTGGKEGHTFNVYLNYSETPYKSNVLSFSEELYEGTIVTIKTNDTQGYYTEYDKTQRIFSAYTFTPKWSSCVIARYYKIVITKLRGIPDSGAIQMSEWNLYDTNQNRYSYPSGTTLTATLNGGSSGSGIGNLIDNNTSTKYCTTAWGSSQTGECTIEIDLGEGNEIRLDNYPYYSYCTANDSTNRDPISWTIYCSENGKRYFQVDTRSDISTIPTTRNTETEKWTYNY